MKTAIKIIGATFATLALVASCTNPAPPEETTTTTEPQTTTTVPVTTTVPETTTTTIPTGECLPNESSGCIGGNSSGEYFKESFNGSPASPTSILNKLPRWITAYAMEDNGGGWEYHPEPMMAQHDSACGAPPATHPIQFAEDSVYQCRDHIMTAMNPSSGGTPNGVISLTPNHMVDLSRGVASVKIDVSTLSPTAGDWWEIWITNPEDYLVAPSDHWFHQTGVPKRALRFSVNDSGNLKRWIGKAFNNYVRVAGDEFEWEAPQIQNLVTRSDTRRDTYEIRIEGNTVKMLVENAAGDGSMVQVNQFDFPPGLLGDKAMVQFVGANYEPEKNGNVNCPSYPCQLNLSPATWHWDNAEIYPAIEYKQIKADQVLVDANTSNEVTFQEPAAAGMDLVFIAHTVGNAPQISFDNGVTWQTAPFVRPNNDPPNAGWGGDPDTMTYRIPVPEGQTSVRVKGTSLWNKTWTAYDFHLIGD